MNEGPLRSISILLSWNAGFPAIAKSIISHRDFADEIVDVNLCGGWAAGMNHTSSATTAVRGTVPPAADDQDESDRTSHRNAKPALLNLPVLPIKKLEMRFQFLNLSLKVFILWVMETPSIDFILTKPDFQFEGASDWEMFTAEKRPPELLPQTVQLR